MIKKLRIEFGLRDELVTEYIHDMRSNKPTMTYYDVHEVYPCPLDRRMRFSFEFQGLGSLFRLQ